MSYVVAQMKKLKADNLVGVGHHNQRKTYVSLDHGQATTYNF